MPDALAGPEEVVEREEAAAAVRRALDRLDERERQLLLLRQEGFRYQEIAELVRVAPGSVGTLLARALHRFREAYQESGPTDDLTMDERDDSHR